MKKTLAIFLSMAVLLCTVPHMVFAATFTDDKGLTYTLNDSNKTATLTNGKSTSGNLEIPGSVSDGYTVTAIGDSAFKGNTGLTSVTIPDSVTTIGSYAFSSCSGLTSVTIPDKVSTLNGTFGYCTGLTSVTLGSGLSSIDGNAFGYCGELTSVTIPCNFKQKQELFKNSGITVSVSDDNTFTNFAGKSGTFVLKHDCEDWAITREPTCTTAGEKTGTCTVCGTVTETIEPKPHSIVPAPEVKATCTKAGTRAHYKCSECDALFSDAAGTTSTTLDALTTDMADHTLTRTPALDSTCVTEGMKEYWTCSKCHGIFSDSAGRTSTTLDALTTDMADHTLTRTPALASTCVSGGRKEYWTCSKCHGIFSDAAGTTSTTLDELKLKALGHDIQKVEKVESTCVATGTKKHYKCSRCHTLFSDENGETSVKEEDLTLPGLDHDWDAGEVTTAATPEKPGIKTYKCSRCGETKTEPVEYVSVPGGGDGDSTDSQPNVAGGDNNSTNLHPGAGGGNSNSSNLRPGAGNGDSSSNNSYSAAEVATMAKRASIKTGDQLGIWVMFYMALLLLSAYGVLVGVRFRRKKDRK